MGPQTYLRVLPAVWFSRLPLHSHWPSSPASAAAKSGPPALKLPATLAIMMLLLPLAQMHLFAQQAPLPGPGWQQNNPYNGQYAQAPQSSYKQRGYGQPAYPQPGYPQLQPYPQQLYAPPSGQGYPQQGYSQQQPYAQQPYAPSNQPYPQQDYEPLKQHRQSRAKEV
jgi:hypothetical protein